MNTAKKPRDDVGHKATRENASARHGDGRSALPAAAALREKSIVVDVPSTLKKGALPPEKAQQSNSARVSVPGDDQAKK